VTSGSNSEPKSKGATMVSSNASGGGDDKEEASDKEEDWDDENSRPPIQRFANALRNEWLAELSYLEVIENTKIPLVKFTHLSSNISVDVCFNQPTGPPAATLMKTYMDAMPPLRPLTFVLKYFLAARGLNEPYSGGVGSFMLQMMITAFLQHRERYNYNYKRQSVYNLGSLLLDIFVSTLYVTTCAAI
jgi:DNA polymerase sigma